MYSQLPIDIDLVIDLFVANCPFFILNRDKLGLEVAAGLGSCTVRW